MTERLKIGITGSEGNVGTTLVKGLAPHHELVLFDRKQQAKTKDHPYTRVDFGEQEESYGLFNGLDAVIHLAGDPRPNAPETSTLRNNFAATSYVFEEAKRAGVGKVVFASSNFYHQGDIEGAIAQQLKHAITLDMDPTPLCDYGRSKVFGENAGRYLSFLGVKFCALRIGWTVPEDNPAQYGGMYMNAVFCSHRDLVTAFMKALETSADFTVAYAVSNNATNVFDLSGTQKALGFLPEDDSATYSR